MNGEDTRPVITWLILVYDRTAAERFPLKRKWYCFNYDRATPAEVQKVLGLVERRLDEKMPPLPTTIGATRVSWSLGGGEHTDRQILMYRQLFDHVPDEKDMFANREHARAFLSVRLEHDTYFEDENGQPITLMQALDEEAKRRGRPGAISIVMDKPESVLRCGPATPVRQELWRQADGELMAHLYEVYSQLIRGRWLKSRCVVSQLSKDKCHAILPIHEDCMAVILPFRQLYSKDKADDLFNRCCKLHNRHCSDRHPSYAWVEYYKAAFNALLDRPVSFPPIQSNLSARRYLDAFAYGARLVHATSRQSDPKTDLKSLLDGHPRAVVVMGYHYILRQLLDYVAMTLPVLWQNVTHWTKDLGWQTGVAPGGRQLFEV